MKRNKRIVAGILAILSAVSCASCGKNGSSSSSSMPIKELKETQQEIVSRLAKGTESTTRKLENSEIKWFSFYDINPTATIDKEIGVDLALFQTKYNGKIKYIQTTWDTKFDDLASLIMANNSPDFVGADDMDIFPKGAINGMLEPIDDYIDFTSPLWEGTKAASDQFMYKGKHYVAVSRVDPSYIFVYNKNVMAENGFDDPAELYENGEWNWDKFAEMCVEFTDAEADKYALDGWYYENALLQSTGVPLIGMSEGKIVNNIESPEIAKAQTMMYDLQKNKVVYPKNEHGWKVRGDVFGNGMASGLTLFYPIGLWAIEDAPTTTEPFGNIANDEVMFVPVPCSADSEKQYVPSRVHGFSIVNKAKNPEGVAAFLDCTRYSEIDEAAHQITLDQYRDDYGWTQQMLDMRDTIYGLAAENPVFEFSIGVTSDLSSITDNVIKGTMNPAETKTWTAIVEEYKKAIDFIINEAQENLNS